MSRPETMLGTWITIYESSTRTVRHSKFLTPYTTHFTPAKHSYSSVICPNLAFRADAAIEQQVSACTKGVIASFGINRRSVADRLKQSVQIHYCQINHARIYLWIFNISVSISILVLRMHFQSIGKYNTSAVRAYIYVYSTSLPEVN